ncbi:hypothetical protein AMAG_18700 [Allomyces macrogynus ATCC 38327]|uniref:Uncharacterized protein n=1 Tax=Allomyces macrogynus (strain ATCC 38327) TaxID=578462 RepID=A0A0L0SE93_ALLM3|nr:hypothetical protein AMAG_18700 [Allomyces macrogynus ATCC 38327]|eukprot:KNE60858.1 hypothetical protein AMAG_18700 [Allomyces macrogynus ATCC 38327]
MASSNNWPSPRVVTVHSAVLDVARASRPRAHMPSLTNRSPCRAAANVWSSHARPRMGRPALKQSSNNTYRREIRVVKTVEKVHEQTRHGLRLQSRRVHGFLERVSQ